MKIEFVEPKTALRISQEWDQIAARRDLQITSGQDASYSEVLEPWILSRATGARSIVDVGCGTGRLTSKLREISTRTIGVDPSAASIAIARSHDRLSIYVNSTIQEWAASESAEEVDLVVANMVLMDAPDLSDTCAALRRIASTGRVLATIAHPVFWPIYWGYYDTPGFEYLKEIVVEAPFKTASLDYELVSTHIHRPISRYLEVFSANHLRILEFCELRGPEPRNKFPFPRFIGIEATIEHERLSPRLT